MTDTANPAQIQEFLDGIEFPTGKSALVEAARNADSNVQRAIKGLPDRNYATPTEVSQSIVEAGNHPERGARGEGGEAGVEPDDDERTGDRFDAG